MMETWIWLRPFWLYALIPLVLLATWHYRRAQYGSAWEKFVDPELQSFVIESDSTGRRSKYWVVYVLWLFTIVLLAGPVWDQRDVPVFQVEKAEVIVLDLSTSMNSDDVPPSRLMRARFKLTDILNSSEGYQTALIAFAERPYVISPLTEDIRTIESFLPSLTTDVMPVQGSRLDLAINQAVKLLQQASITQGHILVITDAEIDGRALAAAASANDDGHVLSVLAVGTEAGKPLRNQQGQFIQNPSGAIVVPRLDRQGIQELAAMGGGAAVVLAGSNEDIRLISSVRHGITVSNDGEDIEAEQKFWVEYAPWGIWILVIATLFSARKGLLQ